MHEWRNSLHLSSEYRISWIFGLFFQNERNEQKPHYWNPQEPRTLCRVLSSYSFGDNDEDDHAPQGMSEVKIVLAGYFGYFLKICRNQKGLRIVNRPWDFLFHSHFLIKVVSKSENVKNPYIANTLGKINIWWNKTKSLISIVTNTKDKVNTKTSWSISRFSLYCSICDFADKAHIFWKGHKILRNLHLTFDWHYVGQK